MVFLIHRSSQKYRPYNCISYLDCIHCYTDKDIGCTSILLSDDLACHYRVFDRGIEVHRFTKYTTSCGDEKQVLEAVYCWRFQETGGENVTFSGTIMHSVHNVVFI